MPIKTGKEAHVKIMEIGKRFKVDTLFEHYLSKVGVGEEGVRPEEMTEEHVKRFVDYANSSLVAMLGGTKTSEIVSALKKELGLEE